MQRRGSIYILWYAVNADKRKWKEEEEFGCYYFSVLLHCIYVEVDNIYYYVHTQQSLVYVTETETRPSFSRAGSTALSCVDAGFTDCCVENCQLSSGCFCNQACYEEDQCCSDIASICSPPPGKLCTIIACLHTL